VNINKNLKKEASREPPFFISYLITDPQEYGDTLENFEKNLTNTLLRNQVDMICFRDKETKDIKFLAKGCQKIAKEFHIEKVILNGNIPLALSLQYDGVHLTSTQFDEIKTAKSQGLYTIISCHSEEEVKKAKLLGADAVTYSPIYYKENKDKPKGCESLKNLVTKYQDENFKIIALGGIVNQQQIQEVQNTHCSGFASIRYFVNKFNNI